MSLIIGASGASEPKKSPLPEPQVDLPRPASAPEGHLLYDEATLEQMLRHENAVVRSWAMEQATRRSSPKLLDAITASLATETDELVLMDALQVLESKRHRPAVDAIFARYATATGAVAAACASALGRMASDRLLEAVKARGRLDTEAYAASATALAVIGSDEVVDFLDKAMNRAGALSGTRRAALYGAAFVSGDQKLSSRVLSLAVESSTAEEPEDASFPARVALSAVAGLPGQYSRREHGLELFDVAREQMTMEVLPALEGEARAALEAALKIKDSSAVLAALAPVLEQAATEKATRVQDEDAVTSELGNMPRRRRGLLAAIIERREAIGALELDAAGVFMAAAARAAGTVIAGSREEATSSAAVALSKTLESRVSPEALVGLDDEALTALFLDTPPRDMRRVTTTLVRESFWRANTFRRFARAVCRGGHALALLEAAAELDQHELHQLIVEVMVEAPAEAEVALLEVLTASPLEEKLVPLAVAAAGHVRTERLGLAIGRRFLELRKLARHDVARAVMRVGDPRLLPVLESRAFKDEPEEMAWAVLSLVSGQEVQGRLAAALGRVSGDRTAEGASVPEDDERLTVTLVCKRCEETLTYRPARAFVDTESKEPAADVAFTQDQVCKACGAQDELAATPETLQSLSMHLLEMLKMVQAQGFLSEAPRVSPALTTVHGKRLGLARALRALNEDVTTSPDSIRARLGRARLLAHLERSGAMADAEHVLSLDARAAEAWMVKATVFTATRAYEAARDAAAESVRLLRTDEARIYDSDSAEAVLEGSEGFLLELEQHGAAVPSDLDLSAARARRAEEIERRTEAYEAAQKRQEAAAPHEDHAHGHSHAHDAQPEPAALERKVGRNDPCPCGSGKKYKKCHGRAH